MYKIAAITALLLSACAAGNARCLYAGLLEPMAGTCDPPAQAELEIHHNSILFAPNSGTLILTGLLNGGTASAAKTVVGADRKSYILMFAGNLHGPEINGIYQSARCRYRVLLHHVSS